MSKTSQGFKFIHMFHAIFIITNILTGILMLGGIKALKIHWISGLLIFAIPVLLTILTIKGKLMYFIFLRPAKISKIPSHVKWLKLSATALLGLVTISFITGVSMISGLSLGGVIFKIHIVSFGFIVTILPIHVLLALFK